MRCSVLAAAFVASAAFSIPDGVGDHARLHLEGGAAAAEKFAAFFQEHSRTYGRDSEEYLERFAHFKAALAAIDAHNKQADRSWTAGVTSLADWSPAELAMLRGYRPGAKRSQSAASLLSSDAAPTDTINLDHLPKDFTWKGQLAALQNVPDQLACGSCWAIATSTVLRAHSELYQQERTFSTQQMVECTPNPRSCGGTGGCEGATAELAMEYAHAAGLLTEEEHRYRGQSGTCASDMEPPSDVSFVATNGNTVGQGGLAFGMMGYETLPENAVKPLLQAVYEKGPVVVSVAANMKWSFYMQGIMNCDQVDAGDNLVVNHAVSLVGYGQEFGKGYWHIQNSWGPKWGESGFIRLKRLGDKEESEHCGWDEKPEDGTGCAGGPEKVWVCGHCAILYDSVVPKFALSEHGIMSKKSRDSEGVFMQINTTKVHHLRH